MHMKKSEETKARILAAGIQEFAQHGVAGARVERIAAAAGCNKQLIYAYYGSKEGLADAVFAAMIEALANDVPFDAADLAAYAGKLFDYYRANPHIQRLNSWYQLERQEELHALPTRLSSMAQKIAAIAQAQAEGLVTTRYAPEEVLALVLRIAAIGHPGSTEARHASSPERMRDVIETTIRTLFDPRERAGKAGPA
jgi:Transcriptional regulator